MKLLSALPAYALFLIRYTTWRLNLTHSGHSWFRLSHTHISVIRIFFFLTLTHWNKDLSATILIQHYERTGPQILHGVDKNNKKLASFESFLFLLLLLLLFYCPLPSTGRHVFIACIMKTAAGSWSGTFLFLSPSVPVTAGKDFPSLSVEFT